MKKIALAAAARQQLQAAVDSPSGRASRTIYGGHDQRLRQTVVALRSGETMAEHQSPGESSVLIISGGMTLKTAQASWQLQAGDYLDLPQDPHSVTAISDAAFLLTVCKEHT